MRYTEIISRHELAKLRDGLEIIGRINRDAVTELEIWVYGITSDPYLLDIAKEAIINSTEDYRNDDGDALLSEGDIELTQIAIPVPLSEDTIDMLMGSGYPIKELGFVYRSGDGEGVRSGNFFEANTLSGNVKLDEFSEIAFADTDLYADEFLKDKGDGRVMNVQRKVQRSEEATVDAPHVPEPPKYETPQPQPQHSTASKVSKLSDLLEDFLG